MPRAARICSQPGCPNTAGQGGRCPAHKRPAWVKNPDIPPTSRAWRKAVLERDEYTCRKCGRPATEADHIISRALAPQLAHDLNNGQALCTSCHRAKTKAEAAARRGA